MPCRDWDDEPSARASGTITELTRMLCDALTLLDAKLGSVPPSCAVWWAAHKREDAARREAAEAKLAAEARRRAVLDKLSPEDRKILGL